MQLIFYALIIIILILFLILVKDYRINIFMTLLCSLVIIKIISNPQLCMLSTLNSSKLFFNSVFVSLFPFLIITNIMMEYNGINIYSSILGSLLCTPFKLPKSCSFPILISFICGYPLGAKYSCDLYEKKLIDKNTCQRLLNIASNASPLFVIGTVGASMLKNYYLGYILLISNYLSCIIMALVLKKDCTNCNTVYIYKKTNPHDTNIGKILKNSIGNSISTVLSIGGFIILFSVITNLLKDDTIFKFIINTICEVIPGCYELLNGIIIGLLEMTNGCYTISYSSINITTKLIILSFLISFSGLSIISQVYSFTYKYNLSIKRYIKRKFLQGIISSCISLFLYKIFYLNTSIFTFSGELSKSSFYNINILLIICYTILLVPYLFELVKSLFNIS